MGSFKFRDRTVNVDIEGNAFSFECDPALSNRIARFSSDCESFGMEVENGNKPASEFLGMCKNIIDGILGTGANDKIFSNRTPDVRDYTDILLYLTDEVKKFKAEGRQISNRAQRRVKK